jgi:glucose-1-phosphate thymidylyltransferase
MPDPSQVTAGVILAAGKGARMYPFSERTPKPILPILNRPILVHQIETMRQCGITDIHVVVGHLGVQIAGALGDGTSLGVRIRFHEQGATLGLAHAVGALEPHVSGPFLLMLGDIFFHLNAPLQPLIDDVVSGQSNASLVSMYEPDPEMVRRNFVIRADESGRVSRVIEKPRYVDSQLKGCAIRRTPRTAMRDEYEITDSIQILIDDGYVVKHWPIVERDLNLTKADDLLMINLVEMERRGLDRLIGERVEIAPGAVITRSVIGDGVIIRHPIRITNSVITPNVVVDSTADIDCVVFNGEHSVYCPSLVEGLSR